MRRCQHGQPLAVDGTGCARCERDKSRCVVCGERLSQVLVDLGIRRHAACEAEDQDDDDSTPWWQR